MKKIKYIIFTILMLFTYNKNVFAGTLSVWANANSVTVGNNVVISVNAKEVFGTFNIKLSDSSILSGPSNGDVDNDTKTYSFVAKKSGSVTISIVPVDMADYDSEGKYTQTKSVTINVVNKSSSASNNSSNNKVTTNEKKTYSSDNNLSSLIIEGYEKELEFDKDKTEYKLEVDSAVDKVNIKATASDKKSTIKGDGEVNLSDGDNNIEVIVTAENGNEKKYKITITVIDKNPIIVDINKRKYTVIKKNNNIIDKLDNYEEKTIKINDMDVIGYYNSNNKLTLVILKDDMGIVNYYIYDNDNYTLYKEVDFKNIKLLILDMPSDKIIDGYHKYSFKIDNIKYIGYKLNKDSNYYLIYGMDIENGKKNLYLYDSKLNSCIRYDKDIYEYLNRKYNNDIKKYKGIILLLGFIIVTILIVIIIKSIACKKKKKKKIINF